MAQQAVYAACRNHHPRSASGLHLLQIYIELLKIRDANPIIYLILFTKASFCYKSVSSLYNILACRLVIPTTRSIFVVSPNSFVIMDHFFWENCLRLVLALILGGIVGIEREYRSKDAGFRTHFLVALGAALFTIISQYGFGDAVRDTSRVAAQVVSGIGFLGAGLIVFQRNVVRGLTTAAGLWVTAAIGMACGAGMFYVAAVVTGLILFGLEVLNEIIPQVGTTALQLAFTSDSKESAKRVIEQIKSDCKEVYSFELHDRRTSHGSIYEVKMEIKVLSGDHNRRILDYMNEFDDVTMMSIE